MKYLTKTAAILLMLLLLCLPVTAHPVDPAQTGTLAIECHYGSSPVSGMTLSLYRVADITPAGEYTLLPAYAGSGAVITGRPDAAGWREAVGHLIRWIGEQGLSPEVTVITAAGGRAVHEPLAAGLYLLTAAPCQKGSYTYTAAPALVGLPLEQPGGGWQYTVTAAPKLARTGTYVPPAIIIPDNPAPTPADKLPQTGLLQWPIALLAAAGLVLLAVGGALRRRREP